MQRQVARSAMALRQREAFPQHVHRPTTEILCCGAKACCTFLHRLGMISPQPLGSAAQSRPLVTGLLHRGAASLAQTAFVALQAGGDGADIGDFTGAEAVDVGSTGPALLGRADRKG